MSLETAVFRMSHLVFQDASRASPGEHRKRATLYEARNICECKESSGYQAHNCAGRCWGGDGRGWIRSGRAEVDGGVGRCFTWNKGYDKGGGVSVDRRRDNAGQVGHCGS